MVCCGVKPARHCTTVYRDVEIQNVGIACGVGMLMDDWYGILEVVSAAGLRVGE